MLNEQTEQDRDDVITAFLDASAALGPSDDEIDALNAAMDEASARLEARYVDRGLKFTFGFRGAFPVQAYGIIDGMRFYFRFRRGMASVHIGEMDPTEPERTFQNRMSRKRAQLMVLQTNIDNGIDVEENTEKMKWVENHHIVKEEPNGLTDYPTIIHSVGRFGKSSLNGILDADEAEQVFIQCLNNQKIIEKA